MKKLLVLILAISMALFAFVGCAKEQPQEPVENPATEEPVTEDPVEDPVVEGGVRTGLAVITSVEKSKDATADAEGFGQSDSVVIAVVVDEEGKVVKAAMDTAQTKINFSTEGKITSDFAAAYKSKQELKEEYGMIKASSIDKEWYEQANAFTDFIVGKTVDEIKGIPTDETGVTTEPDLVSSVTMKINGYKEAAVKAIENAQNLGASVDDELGLGIVTTIAKSSDATADKEGQTQAYSIYTTTTFDKDGKITSNIADASQATVKFDATGKITTDLTAPVKTKVELGDEYGMKGASDIGKEWYEQAASFSEYVTGKTLDEVKGIVDEEGNTTDAELVSSVTVGVNDFVIAIEKALNSTK